MALTGIFLILFLVVHLIGNLQLLKADGGEAFNTYAYFMTHNPLIKTVSYTLYASILLHAFQGIALWNKNRASSGGSRYAVSHRNEGELNARSMAWLGIIIFIFLALHMWQFWAQMHWGSVPFVEYTNTDHPVKDLYTLVDNSYQNIVFVIIYVVSMVVVGMHLWHGFWSAFQTFGLTNKKYLPLINFLGKGFSVVVSALFALIPIWMYLR